MVTTRERKHVVEIVDTSVDDPSFEQDWPEQDWPEPEETNKGENEDEEEPIRETNSTRKPPLDPKRKASTRKPSKVWEHFTKENPLNPYNPKRICNYCHRSFACDGKSNGTSHLNYHISQACKSIPRESDKKQKTLAFGKNSESESSTNLITWSCNKEECRKSLARMLIIDELAFSFVEGEGFLDFCRNMCPSFDVPSRRPICRDVLSLYGDAKVHLRDMISKCVHGVCLTTDTWISCQNVNYMVLTAHFIDSDWKLHKRILNFCVITSHKGEKIGKLIVSCIKQWELKRIVSITVDNASANEVAINYVKNALNRYNGCVLNGEFLHVRCCTHIINLIVNDSLKEISSTIVGIRTAVRFVRSSPARLSKFKELSVNLGINDKSMLTLDVSTRWNSTYLMLEAALKYRKVFDEMKETDGIYIAYFNDEIGGPPNLEDWKNVEIFVKFLKFFYDVTLKFSSSLSITSNVCFTELSEIQEELQELIEKMDRNLSKMATSMKTKFDKYLGSVSRMNKVLFVTCVLDPRYKLQFLKFCLDDMHDKEVADDILASVKHTLVRFFNFYSTDSTFGIQTDESHHNTSIASGSSESGGSVYSRRMNTILKQVQQQDNGCNELEKYLNDPIEVGTSSFDVLLWWKVNSPKYRVLSLVARDLLAISVSTVASESAFSTGGRVIDRFRSSLSPRMVHALVITQNWLRSKPIFVDHRIDVSIDDVNYYDDAFSDLYMDVEV